MNCRSLSWKLLLAAGLAASFVRPVAAQTRNNQIKSDEAVYDQIVHDFIQFDIGNVRDPFAIERIKARFNGLKTDDAVPALVRGLNASTRMRASCPISALSGKLRTILQNSQNAEVGTFVLRNLNVRDAGAYTGHVRGVHDAAEKQIVRVQTKAGAEQHFKNRFQDDDQRLAYVPGMKLSNLASREPAAPRTGDGERPETKPAAKPRSNPGAPGQDRKKAAQPSAADLSKLSVDELAERLADRTMQAKSLAELNRRASQENGQEIADQTDAVIECLKDGDDAAREAAARLLGLIRSQKAVPALIDILEDSNAQVRSSAATSLTRITRQLFGPSDNATPDETKQAIARWREWWNRQSKIVER